MFLCSSKQIRFAWWKKINQPEILFIHRLSEGRSA